MAERRVVIIGGGLAGLACANHLKRNQIPFLLLEGGTSFGGRVATDVVEGFQLDHGFQVLLSSYPEARKMLDYDALKLHQFSAGAIIHRNGKFHKVFDPFREPATALETVMCLVGNLKDKVLVAKLVLSVNENDLNSEEFKRCRTLDELYSLGFSEEFIDAFFRPFFGGIFLEANLDTNAAMFRYLFKMFSLGHASLPMRGMHKMPEQLADALDPSDYRLNCRVDHLSDHAVVLESGEVIEATQTVVATNWMAAARLFNREPVCESRSVTCVYFAVNGKVNGAEATLYLNGEGDSLINNLCFPSLVAPDYAPPGRTLVSVTVLGDAPMPDEELVSKLQAELTGWFGDQVRTWRHLGTYRVHHALPNQEPGLIPAPVGSEQSNNVFVCGDYTENASINGALVSGRKAAEAVVRQYQTAAAI